MAIDLESADDMTLESLASGTDQSHQLDRLNRIEKRILQTGKIDRATMESIEESFPSAISPDYPTKAYTTEPSSIYVEQSLESISLGRALLAGAAVVSVAAAFYLIYKKIKERNVAKEIQDIVDESDDVTRLIQDHQETVQNEKSPEAERQEALERLGSGDFNYLGLVQVESSREISNWIGLWKEGSRRGSLLSNYNELVGQMKEMSEFLSRSIAEFNKALSAGINDSPEKTHDTLRKIRKEQESRLKRFDLIGLVEAVKRPQEQALGRMTVSEAMRSRLHQNEDFLTFAIPCNVRSELYMDVASLDASLKSFVSLEKDMLSIKHMDSAAAKRESARIGKPAGLSKETTDLMSDYKEETNAQMLAFGQAFQMMRVYRAFVAEIVKSKHAYVEAAATKEVEIRNGHYGPHVPSQSNRRRR